MLDHLLVADLHCPQIQALVAEAQQPVLDGAHQSHALEWISWGLRQRRAEGDPPRVLHLIAHGRPGAFRIGDAWIDAEALKAHANELAHWGVETIALWSCCVGADAGFVALLEELSGARVLAGASWLGRDGANERLQLGDWQLSDLVKEEAWPAQFRLEDDDLIGSDQADQVDAGVGDDDVDGGAGDDVLDGGSGDDALDGGAGADDIEGGKGDDVLDGGSGDDVLDGGQGDDVLEGGRGADTFLLGPGDDVVLDFRPGVDSLQLNSDAPYRLQADGDAVLILQGDSIYRIEGVSLAAVEAELPASSAGSGDDELDGGGGDDVLDGGAGADAIEGGQGDDVLDGGSGEDELDGGAGGDDLDGGKGIDAIDGGAGADVLDGGKGDDELNGGKGDDSLTGGAGQDDFELSDGDDVILDFEDGTDVISVRSYKDLSLEQDGDDVLIIRGDEQTRVLNSTVDAVADSLVRVDARLENSPLTDGQRDDLRAAFRRLLAGKAVDAGAIGDELSKDQKKGLLRSLRSVMEHEPLVSDDVLSEITAEQQESLISGVKRLLDGKDVSKDQIGSIFSEQEKQALNSVLEGLTVASFASFSAQEEVDKETHVDGAIYGVDDKNNVWQIDPSAGSDLNGQTFAMVLNAWDPIGQHDRLTTKNQSNGIAFDTCRNDLFYFYNFKSKNGNKSHVTPSGNVPTTVDGNWNIVWWNLANDPDDAQAWDWIGNDKNKIPDFGSTKSSPANAAFYEDSIWYFSDDKLLYQLRLEYEGRDKCVASSRQKIVPPKPPKTVELIKYDIKNYTKRGFGDIAIDVTNGVLYGAQAGVYFFSVDFDEVLTAADENRTKIRALSKDASQECI